MFINWMPKTVNSYPRWRTSSYLPEKIPIGNVVNYLTIVDLEYFDVNVFSVTKTKYFK